MKKQKTQNKIISLGRCGMDKPTINKQFILPFSTLPSEQPPKPTNPVIKIYVSMKEVIDWNLFNEKITTRLEGGVSHSVYIKFQFKNEVYKMAGSQFSFYFKQQGDDYIKALHSLLNQFLEKTTLKYGFEGFPESILLVFRPIEGNVNTITLRKLLSNKPQIADTKLYNFNKPLPLTTNHYKYGINLQPVYSNNSISHFIKPNYLGGELVFKNFGEEYLKQTLNMKVENILDFKQTDLYYFLDGLLVYVVIRGNISTKYIFGDSAVVLYTIVDYGTSDTNFTREMGNVILKIESGVVTEYKVNKNLMPIKYKRNKTLDISDTRFGTLDLETYPTSEGYNKVYAAGFYTEGDLNMFYIDNNLNSDQVILSLVDAMLVDKYNNYVYYVHNLSGYDAPFIIKTLLDYNSKQGIDIYGIETLFRDGRVIYMTVSKKIPISDKPGDKIKKVKFTLHDSYLLLGSSLSSLGKSYNVDVIKGVFPHTFARHNTLFYKGEIPSKTHYPYTSDDEYLKLYKKDWDFKIECLKYLECDLVSLHLIMSKFKKTVHQLYGVEVLKALTISRLAYDIFMTNYYNNNISLINNKDMWLSIKEAYYGGISEVYRPYGENLYYYDVNSLYPYAALNDMPGLTCIYKDFLGRGRDLNDLFGFYYCDIECDNSYLGLLPVRGRTASILLPNGKWSGWYFSEELKFAKANGYKINVKYGYTFNREGEVYDNYIKDMYKTKVESKDNISRAISKSLLNNLLGRFGMSINKPTTTLVSQDELHKLDMTRKIINSIPITKDCSLITLYPEVSKEICDDFGVDYMAALENDVEIKSLTKRREFSNVNIGISAAVNSYARIHMGKLKLDLLNKGYKLYYTDTDSIVLDKPLDDSMIGTDLGLFKLEHTIKRGYFISSKLYCLVTHEDKIHVKSKGGINKSLVEKDFINLLQNIDAKGEKTQSKIRYDQGSVTISTSEMTFHSNAYKNRVKVYDDKDLWVNTKPITIGLDKTEDGATLVNNLDNNTSTECDVKSKLNKLKSAKDTKFNVFILCGLLFLLFILYLLSFILIDEDPENEGFNNESLEPGNEGFNNDSDNPNEPEIDDTIKEVLPDKAESKAKMELVESVDDVMSSENEDDVTPSRNEEINLNDEPALESRPTEMDILRFRIRNFDAFIENGSIVVVDNRQLTEEQLDTLEGLINDRTNSTESDSESEWDIEPTTQSSCLYETLIRRIRNGDNLTVYSHADSEFSNEALASVLSDDELELTKGKAIENRLNEESTSSSGDSRDGEPKVTRKFIIVSTPGTTNSIVLPSIEPSNSDTIDPIVRERNLAIQKMWASKFPFYPEHQEQMLRGSAKDLEEAIRLQNIDNKFIGETPEEIIHKKLYNDRLTKHLFSNDLMSKDEPACIDKLYEEAEKEEAEVETNARKHWDTKLSPQEKEFVDSIKEHAVSESVKERLAIEVEKDNKSGNTTLKEQSHESKQLETSKPQNDVFEDDSLGDAMRDLFNEDDK